MLQRLRGDQAGRPVRTRSGAVQGLPPGGPASPRTGATRPREGERRQRRSGASRIAHGLTLADLAARSPEPDVLAQVMRDEVERGRVRQDGDRLTLDRAAFDADL